jgi:hypothetical protein
MPTRLYGVTLQKIALLMVTAARTSHLTIQKLIEMYIKRIWYADINLHEADRMKSSAWLILRS